MTLMFGGHIETVSRKIASKDTQGMRGRNNAGLEVNRGTENSGINTQYGFTVLSTYKSIHLC